MRIEHLALNVDEPTKMAEWYCRHCFCTIKRKLPGDTETHFIADSTGQVMLEIYRNEEAVIPDYFDIHPLELHLAFAVDDVDAEISRMEIAGAALVHGPITTEAGDKMCMMRDPWGLSFQLLTRKEPMLG